MPPLPSAWENIHALFRTQATEEETEDIPLILIHFGGGYDYFYGQQAEMFAFYRVPKVLFTEDCFWNVSTDAKLLYGILLDRMNLSARNGWLDEEGRVYIIFTIEEIKGALGCAEKKAVKLLDELEKKCGLIERKRQGLGKPNLIYVKNFISGSVERQFLNCQKHKVIILILIILI